MLVVTYWRVGHVWNRRIKVFALVQQECLKKAESPCSTQEADSHICRSRGVFGLHLFIVVTLQVTYMQKHRKEFETFETPSSMWETASCNSEMNIKQHLQYTENKVSVWGRHAVYFLFKVPLPDFCGKLWNTCCFRGKSPKWNTVMSFRDFKNKHSGFFA